MQDDSPDPIGGLIGGFIAIIIGVALLWRGKKLYKTFAEAVLSAATRIGSLAAARSDQPVKIEGTVRSTTEDLESPLSSEPCAYYRFFIEDYHGSHLPGVGQESKPFLVTDDGRVKYTGGGRYWRPLSRDSRPDTFIIEDKTGNIIVRPHKASLLVRQRVAERATWATQFIDRINRGLKTKGLSLGNFSLGRRARSREVVLREGERVFVIGVPEYKEGRVEISAAGPVPFVISTFSPEKVARAYRRVNLRYRIWGGLLLGLGVISFLGSLAALLAP